MNHILYFLAFHPSPLFLVTSLFHLLLLGSGSVMLSSRKLQFCTEQPLVQTVFSDHTHGHPLAVVQRLLCFVSSGLMRNWEMEHISWGLCGFEIGLVHDPAHSLS